MIRIFAATCAAAALIAASADAQSYVREDCRTLIGAAPVQDALTAGWYRRFWTGDCANLKGCLAGAPNWNQVVAGLTSRAPSVRKAMVHRRACRLGARIGQEWTRPEAVRRIDSADLRAFRATLERSGDVIAGLALVEAKVAAKTGR